MTYRRASIAAASIAAAEAANATGCNMEVRLPNGLVVAAIPGTHRPRPVDTEATPMPVEAPAHFAPDGGEIWDAQG